MNRILGSLAVLGVIVVAAVALRPPFPFDGKGPPKGYKLGKLMPPHVREGLDLTEEQDQELRALEAEVRGKLEKILTAQQRRLVEKLGKRPPGPPPRDLPEPEARLKKEDGGIAWFTSLDAGLKEARRSGRPILFVSAAPHCAGVSGIW
jgi:hypothetical protein